MTTGTYENAIALPDSVWGYFEWLTGTVRINRDLDSFDLNTIISQNDSGFCETYYHEMFHCCQICTSGFLYYYVAHFLQAIIPIWRQLTEEGVTEQRIATQVIGNVIDKTPDLPNAIVKMFAHLDEKNVVTGLTTRDIVEGQAFLIQKCMVNDTLSHEAFLNICAAEQFDIYTKAYAIVTDIFEDYAFQIFNIIVSESLNYLEPQEVFHIICTSIKTMLDTGTFLEDAILHIRIETSKNHLYLGNSSQVTQNNIKNQEINPFYTANISFLNSIGRRKGISMEMMMRDPTVWFKDNITKMDTLILLNPARVYHQSKMKKWRVFGKKYNPNIRLVLASICLVMHNRKGNNSPQYLHLKR
jgi:hypothetical protein